MFLQGYCRCCPLLGIPSRFFCEWVYLATRWRNALCSPWFLLDVLCRLYISSFACQDVAIFLVLQLLEKAHLLQLIVSYQPTTLQKLAKVRPHSRPFCPQTLSPFFLERLSSIWPATALFSLSVEAASFRASSTSLVRSGVTTVYDAEKELSSRRSC